MFLQANDLLYPPAPAPAATELRDVVPAQQRPQVRLLLNALQLAAQDREFAPMVRAIVPAPGMVDQDAFNAAIGSINQSLSRHENTENTIRRLAAAIKELQASRIQGNGQGGLIGSASDYPRRLAILAATKPEYAGCRVAQLALGAPVVVAAPGVSTFTTTGAPTADVALGIIFIDDPQGIVGSVTSFGLNAGTRPLSLFPGGELGAEVYRSQSQTFSPFQSGFPVRGKISAVTLAIRALAAGQYTVNYWGLVRGSDVGLPAGLLLDQPENDCSCSAPVAGY